MYEVSVSFIFLLGQFDEKWKGSALNEINIAVAGFVCQKVKVSNAKVRQEDACRHHGLHCDKYMTSKSVTLQFINVSRTNLKEKKPWLLNSSISV